MNASLKNFFKKYKIDKKGTTAGTIGIYGANRFFRRNNAPYANEFIRRFLHKILDEDQINGGGLMVYTTLDYAKQKAANYAIRASISAVRKKIKKAAPSKTAALSKIINTTNGIFLAVDPASGAINALVGGYSISENTFQDRIWTMRRQPGSAIKGFLYALALEKQIIENDATVVDEAIDFSGYKPKNWYQGFKGELDLGTAIAISSNTTAVKILAKLGIGYFKDKLTECLNIGFFEGKKRFPSNLTLALGSAELSPIELIKIYAPFLNRGFLIEPHLIRRIETAKREVIWSREKDDDLDSFISERTSAQILQLLRQVIENQKGTVHWLAEKANVFPFPIAAKTGTVGLDKKIKRRYGKMVGNRDAWFVALVPTEVLGAIFSITLPSLSIKNF